MVPHQVHCPLIRYWAFPPSLWVSCPGGRSDAAMLQLWKFKFVPPFCDERTAFFAPLIFCSVLVLNVGCQRARVTRRLAPPQQRQRLLLWTVWDERRVIRRGSGDKTDGELGAEPSSQGKHPGRQARVGRMHLITFPCLVPEQGQRHTRLGIGGSHK